MARRSRARNMARLLGSGSALTTTASGSVELRSGVSGGGSVSTVSTHSSLTYSGHSTGDLKYVDSADRLYIWGGTGWYSIAITNKNPRFTTSPLSSYDLDSNGGTATTLNLVAADSDQQPLNWTFSTTDSAYDLATMINDSNGTFRITGKSLAQILAAGYDSSGGSFDITFKATDGINFAGASSTFSLTYSDPNSLAAFTTWAQSVADYTDTSSSSASALFGTNYGTYYWVYWTSCPAASGSMWGTPWNNGPFTNDSAFNRVIQHSVNSSTTHSTLITNGDPVLLRMQHSSTNAASFPATNRNGFTSSSYNSFKPAYVTDCVWYNSTNGQAYRSDPYDGVYHGAVEVTNLYSVVPQ